MQTLLERSRRINRMLQTTGGRPVEFSEMAAILSDVIRSTVLVISRKGKVLGYAVPVGHKELPLTEGMAFSEAFNRSLMRIDFTSANLDEPDLRGELLGARSSEAQLNTVVPINSGGERMGTLLLERSAEPFLDEDLILAESGATVVGMEILRAKAEKIELEARSKAAVQVAVGTLSFSEMEAIQHIFDELEGQEGLLVASKIADRVGITRSVIVNALRKFESAGVIEARSLGMKGTHIKVLNDHLLEELQRNR